MNALHPTPRRFARGVAAFLVAWIWATGCLAASTLEPRLRAARGFMGDGLFDLARRELTLLLEEAPESLAATEARFLLGECAWRSGERDEARRHFEAYLTEAPGGPRAPDALLRLGDLALASGDAPAAIRHLGRLITEHPTSNLVPDALLRRSRARRSLGDQAGAQADLERLIAEFPAAAVAPYARFDLATLRLESGNPQAALETLDSLFAAGEVPEALLPHARREEARARLRLGDAEGALRALDAGAGGPGVDRLYGEVYTALGRHEDAIVAFERALAADPDDEAARYGYAYGLAQVGRDPEARAAFEKTASSSGPYQIPALLALAEMERKRGDAEAAAAQLDRVLAAGARGDVRARALVDRALLTPADPRAIEWLETAAAIDGAKPETVEAAHMARARILFDRGRFREAAGAYADAERVAARRPGGDPSEARYGRALALFRAGDVDAARAVEPRQGERAVDLLLVQAEAQIARGELDAAADTYRAVLEAEGLREAARIEAWFGLGWCHLESGNGVEALKAFDRVATEAPDTPRGLEALLRMGDAFALLGDDRGAVEFYGLCLQHEPDSRLALEAQLGRARALVRLRRFEEAARAARAARQFAKGDPDAEARAILLEGRAHFEKEDFAAAESLYVEAAVRARDPALAEQALYRVGDSRFNRGDALGAARAYALVLRRFPTGALAGQAVNGLLWAAAESGGKVDADAEIARARELAGPAGAGIALHAALILRDRGREEEARRALRELIASYPSTPEAAEARYVMAGMWEAAGQADSARVYWETLVREAPDHRRAADARRHLAARALDEGRPADAEAWLEPIERPDPQTRLLRAIALSDLGRRAEASRILREVVEDASSPLSVRDRWRAQLALGRIEVAADSTREAGMERLRRVVSEGPPDLGAEAQYGIGARLYAEERYEDALAAFLRIRYLFPEEKTWIRRAELAAGAAYEAMGRRPEAVALYEKLAKGEDPVAKEAQRRLQGNEGRDAAGEGGR